MAVEGSSADAAADRPAPEPPTGIQAELAVADGRAAVEFYKLALGAVEVYRVGGTDENPALVSQLAIGSAWFWVADAGPANMTISPLDAGGGTVRLLLVVADPDAVVTRALAAGAREVHPVGEEHGWRLGRIQDPFGHQWEVGRPLGPWPPPGGHPRPADA